jgi:hypothetical protein
VAAEALGVTEEEEAAFPIPEDLFRTWADAGAGM